MKGATLAAMGIRGVVGVASLGWVLAGCAGDDTQAAEGTETEGTSADDAPTTNPMPSTSGPTSGEDTSTSSDPDTTAGSGTGPDETGTSTGDPPVDGQVRLIITDDLETRGLDEVFRFDYADGTLDEPVKISGPAGDGVVQPSLSPMETMLFYRPLDSTGMTLEYEYIPLSDGEAGPTSPMHQAPAPDPGVYSRPVIFEDETRIAYWGTTGMMGPETIYLADVGAAGIEAPEIAINGPVGANINVGTTEEWLSFRRDADGALNAFVIPINPLDPDGAMQVSDLDEGDQSTLGSPVFVPGDEAVWYRADRDVDQVDEIFFVDISGAMPAAPVKVNDPIPPGDDLQPVRLAPGGDKVAYFVGADLAGEVYLVTFDGTTVSMPVELSTLGDREAFPADMGWSGDGTWLAYLGEHEQAGALDLYIVDTSGAMPSSPMLVTAPGVIPDGSGVMAYRFDPTGQWLYVIASIDEEAPELYRSDLSSGMPDALQKVSAELPDGGFLPGTIILSHDAGRVLYHLDANPQTLWMVDVSGDKPGAAQLVNGPLEQDEEVSFSTWWSHDDSVILYRTQTGPGDAPRPLWLVERDELEMPILVADNPEGVVVLDQ